MDETEIAHLNRINVVGTSGSGKTTFSKLLANKLEIRHIELDAIFWGPNWYWPPDEEFFENVKNALNEHKKWVLDGNYTRTIPIKWQNVDAVIWLDYSFCRTLFQSLKRALRRSLLKEELWQGTGNRESFRRTFFSKESIILWTLKTHAKVKIKYEKLMNDSQYSKIHFIRLKSPSEASKFLSELNI